VTAFASRISGIEAEGAYEVLAKAQRLGDGDESFQSEPSGQAAIR
jgi:hypothetical protein